jgi:tripartite-type tricarboxylate transporter receptor subunit TctC
MPLSVSQQWTGARTKQESWTSSMLLNFVLSVFLLLCATLSPARADWAPAKPVEFVVLAGPNGGSNKAVQLIIDIVKKHNLANISFTVVYKPANSGAEGFEYFLKAPDIDHTLVFSSTAFYVVPLRHPELGIDLSLFAPIAGMGVDTMILWVPGGRKDINTLADFANAVREKKAKTGQDWVMSGFGEESTSRLLTNFLEANYEIKLKYLTTLSGGDSGKQVMEGQAESTINPPAPLNDAYKTGKLKPVVAFSEERQKEFANVPTMIETGVKFSLEPQRSISGPPGMSPEAREYYSRLFRKVFDTPEWQDYRVKSSLHGQFTSGPELLKSMLRELKMHRVMISFMDMIKNLDVKKSSP